MTTTTTWTVTPTFEEDGGVTRGRAVLDSATDDALGTRAWRGP